MKIESFVKNDNDLISCLNEIGFNYSLAHYLYHHLENVKVNGALPTSFALKKGDRIEIILEEKTKEYGNSNNPLDVIYEDDYILIVNKPHNIATIPTINHYDNNLSSDVNAYYKKHNIHAKIHVVNRLDYETSGLVIFAKHQYIHSLFSNIKITKHYHALVEGKIEEDGEINKPIKKIGQEKKRIIASDGKPSITQYEVIAKNEHSTFLDINLLTGRTHQIRLHFASILHPLIGDNLYGNGKNKDTLCLDCYYLEFIHPITHKLCIINKD